MCIQDVSDRVQSSQSHNIHRVVSFEPLAPAALFLRILLTFIAGQQAAQAALPDASWLRWVGVGLLVWTLAFAAKVALGYWLQHASCAYANHYQHRYGRAARPAALRSVTFASNKSVHSTGKL